MLQSQELCIEQQTVSMNLEPHSANVAFKKGGQNRGYQGANHQRQQPHRGNYNNRGGRGRGRGGRGNFRPICQICSKTGHLASNCYFRFDHNFVSSSNTNTSQHSNHTGNTSAFVASPKTIGDSSCYVDSGATNHITADLNNLSLQNDFKGKDKITVGNGHTLSISHTRSILVSSSDKPLLLNNILYAPKITKNLLSVSQITKDYNVFAQFHSNYCLFKDKNTKKVLLQRTLKGGLYQLDISKLEGGLKLGSSIYGVNKSQTSSNKTCCANSVSLLYDVVNLSIPNKQRSTGCIAESSINCKPANLWHFRLGHPSNRILRAVLSKLNINENIMLIFAHLVNMESLINCLSHPLNCILLIFLILCILMCGVHHPFYL